MAGMGDFNKLMKQAQQMQSQFADMQKKLDMIRITGTSGGGMVSLEINGLGNLLSVNIDQKLLAPTEGEIISDLIVAAYSDAKSKLDDTVANQLGGMMPEGLKLPF